jgi:ubiquitin-conjugating enzyme E2 J1
VNREICLSISGHHEETWQPAWGVRTALVAIRSFMDTDAKGQLGGIECSREAREKMAKESTAWKCSACVKSNAEVMKEREELVQEIEEKEGKRKEEEIPEELRLAYRDELVSKGEPSGDTEKGTAKAADLPAQDAPPTPASNAAPVVSTTNTAPRTASATTPRPTRTTRATTIQQPAQRSPDRQGAMVDTLIYGIVAALLFMVLKRFA